MKHPHVWLIVGTLVVLPATTAAQPTTPPAVPVAAQAPKPPASQPAEPAAAQVMYEDIEIMRRILIRELHAHQQAACASCHGGMRAAAIAPDGKYVTLQYSDAKVATSTAASGPMTGSQMASTFSGLGTGAPALQVEGSYLKDYGVVFQVVMPALFPTKSEPQPSVVQSLSDWERVRKELRGEKPASTATQPRVPDLLEVLLKSAAENGRNFSKLGPKENLTIVVSFRPAGDPHAGVSMSGFWARSTLTTLPDSSRQPSSNLFKPGDRKAEPDRYGPGEHDAELLGDLQSKQGRVAEAIQAYQRAIAVHPGGTHKAHLYQKLAQAYLKLDEKTADFKSATSNALEALKNALQQSKAGSTSSTTAPPLKLLVSKLIVTLPKSLLDSAGQGLSFDEIRQAARVERITVPQDAPKAATAEKGS